MNRDQIIQLEYRLIDAIRDNDVKYLESILHESLLFMLPDGRVITREADLASHTAREMKVDELACQFEAVNVIGDAAVSVLVYQTSGTMLGRPIHGSFRYVRVWKQFDDGIKVIGGSCVQIS